MRLALKATHADKPGTIKLMLLLLFSVITELLTADTLLPLWRWQHWLIRSFDFPRLQFAIALVAFLILELMLMTWTEINSRTMIRFCYACMQYHISMCIR